MPRGCAPPTTARGDPKRRVPFYAAWATLVNSGVLDVAFLVNAHCSVGDVRQCWKYSHASEGRASKVHGAPTTARATQHLFEDNNDARPTTSAIRPGGILAISHPTFAKGIRRSSHSCSGRLLVIQHEHMTYIAVYGIASASSSPGRITAVIQLAAAAREVVLSARSTNTPVMVLGDLNAVLAPIDRLGGGLHSYDRKDAYSLPRVLTRLGLVDLHGQISGGGTLHMERRHRHLPVADRCDVGR